MSISTHKDDFFYTGDYEGYTGCNTMECGFCIDCGKPVIVMATSAWTDEYLEYWGFCANPECLHHIGEKFIIPNPASDEKCTPEWVDVSLCPQCKGIGIAWTLHIDEEMSKPGNPRYYIPTFLGTPLDDYPKYIVGMCTTCMGSGHARKTKEV